MDTQIITTTLLTVLGFLFTVIWKKLDKIDESVNRLVSSDARRDEQIKTVTKDIEELYNRVSALEAKTAKSVV
jgi:hypothetical protein